MNIENYKAGFSKQKDTVEWNTSTMTFICSPVARQWLARNIQKRTPFNFKTSLSMKEVNLCILKGNIPLIAAILFGSNVLRPRALAPITLHNKVFLGNKTRTRWRAAYLGLVFCRAFTKWFPRTFTFLAGSPTNSFVKQKHSKKIN